MITTLSALEASGATGRQRARLLPFLAFAVCGLPNVATAQRAKTLDTPTTTNAAAPSSVLLDAPINRRTYILGSGDVLDISMLGSESQLWTVAVGPEGNVLIPTVGVSPVAGVPLDQAERQIRALVLRLYTNVQVSVSLAQIRSFKVFLVGNTPSAGVRIASAATRVSEIIPDVASGPHRRNVILRHPNGDSVQVDLIRFQQTGDLSANPMLHEGDQVIVPTIDQVVQVFGRVHFPGAYEYRKGETLAQLLAITNGGVEFPSNAADTVRVARFTGTDRRATRAFTRQEATGAAGAAYVLEPFDAIYISERANFKQQRNASIFGQLVFPGTYPIVPGVTTVRELVAMAGGFLNDASLVETTLRRNFPAPPGEAVAKLTQLPPELLSDEERRILQTRSLSDPTVVVIDFRELFAAGKEALDQPIEADDVLRVPIRRTGVTVLGAVAQPGIVQYSPGQPLDYYVGRAGGYGRQADKENRTVLRAQLGNRVDARDVATIDPGDQIIVPYREPTQYLQTFQRVVAVTTGILVSILTLKNLLNY